MRVKMQIRDPTSSRSDSGKLGSDSGISFKKHSGVICQRTESTGRISKLRKL